VVRDLPAALAAAGWQVTVLTPSYQVFHELKGAVTAGTVTATFRGDELSAAVYDVPGSSPGVRNIVFEHALLSPQGPGIIYCGDEPERPYASDASKFALFAALAANWIMQLEEPPRVVHLHDWHAATYLVLREFGEAFRSLRSIRAVYTVHNLFYQGARPISDDESSLEAWFPELRFTYSAVRDPRFAECYNPMAAAIRLADRISTVSPTYAEEICQPSDVALGFIGAEGLEGELVAARDGGRLVGILNGCEYGRPAGRSPGWPGIVKLAKQQVDAWLTANPASRIHAIAQNRLNALPQRRPRHVLTSIGRLVEQKVSLMFAPLPDGRLALEQVLSDLGRDGVVFMLGSGDGHYEQRMADIAEQADNLVFLCGYSETLADPLYRAGDLFLMPSSFEPCGISQMLAMKAGQPCVVHGVGGLKDTVANGRTGFVFNGDSVAEQAVAFVDTVRKALSVRDTGDQRWETIRRRAASRRFTWEKAAATTIKVLYDD
jgi:starch synthase